MVSKYLRRSLYWMWLQMPLLLIIFTAYCSFVVNVRVKDNLPWNTICAVGYTNQESVNLCKSAADDALPIVTFVNIVDVLLTWYLLIVIGEFLLEILDQKISGWWTFVKLPDKDNQVAYVLKFIERRKVYYLGTKFGNVRSHKKALRFETKTPFPKEKLRKFIYFETD